MKQFVFNPVDNTLTITAAFADKIQDFKSDEYKTYMQFMADIPGLTVLRKTHKTPNKYHTKSGEKFNCNQFKNLTYKNMEGFICGLPNNQAYLDAFKFLKQYGALVQTARYTVVREWFMAQFPEFRKDPLFYLYNQPEVIDFSSILEKAKAREKELEMQKKRLAEENAKEQAEEKDA